MLSDASRQTADLVENEDALGGADITCHTDCALADLARGGLGSLDVGNRRGCARGNERLGDPAP